MSSVHPQVKSLLEAAKAANIKPWDQLTVAEARVAFASQRLNLQGSPPAVDEVVELTLPLTNRCVPIRAYRPCGKKDVNIPIYVHFHGGGWVLGDLDSHDTLCRYLCNESEALVISVNYRLAPEYKYPAALDDAWESVCWIEANGEELQADPKRLAIGGDSAGGTLAATVCSRARDNGKFPIQLQVLIYPVTDMTLSHPSMTQCGKGYILTKSLMEWFRKHYLPDEAMWRDPDASPLHSRDLSKLPEAFILTAGFDPLRDEGKAYADALSASGVSTEYICYEKMIHGFLNMPAVLDQGREAITQTAAFIKKKLNR